MAATPITGVGLLLLLGLLGGGTGLPLGMPPQAENPLMTRVAPENCLFYATKAAVAQPQANAETATERLLAEPEVAQLLASLDGAISRGAAKAAEDDPTLKVVADQGVFLGKLLFSQAAALYVEHFNLGPEGVKINAGLLVHTGEDSARVKADLEKLQTQFLPNQAEAITVADTPAYRLTLGPSAPEIVWGMKGPYLLVAVGPQGMEKMLAQAATAPPAWLTKLQTDLPMPRRSTLLYINTQQVREIARQQLGEPMVNMAMQLTGLGNVTLMASTTGLDKQGYSSRSLLALDGEPAGAIALLAGEPLTVDHLQAIPRDATLALAARIKPEQVGSLLQQLAALSPIRDEIERDLGQLDQFLGFQLQQELFPALGDVWRLYHSPGETGLLPTGATLIVNVRDRAQLATIEGKILDRLRAAADAENDRDSVTPKTFTYANQTIHYLMLPESAPISLAWCLTEKELIVGLSPQSIQVVLARGADYQSLATQPAVQALFAEPSPPTMLVYQDTKALVTALYPAAQMMLHMAAGARDIAGTLDVSLLPTAKTLTRHLHPSVTAVRRTPLGIESVSHQTLPGGNIGSTAAISGALLLPAVSAARGAAQRASAMSNLRQIGLAAMVYENTYNRFPPAYSVDKEGKPLLSWRVHLLPYMDEPGLYRQFHLDEPWDSEHNRKLIAQMPAIFASPGVKLSPGMTHYVTLRGENTMFPGDKKISQLDLLDGSSNTILAVEAGPKSAVVWTKPDDLKVDEKDPTAGLFGLRREGFLAVFCDGHVSTIAPSVDPQALLQLFNRNDQ